MVGVRGSVAACSTLLQQSAEDRPVTGQESDDDDAGLTATCSLPLTASSSHLRIGGQP